MEVTKDRPSGATSTHSSSVVPVVSCSSIPLGKRCRQMCEPPPLSAEKYIHFPSGDQAAPEHPRGPTFLAFELPSNGATRHSCHPWSPNMAFMRTCLRSGDRNELWFIMPA